MKQIICSLVCICLIAVSFPSPRAAADSTIEANVADLERQLVSGLKVTRKDDLAYIAKVVMMVSEDELPLELVKAAFQWTRKNPKARKYPFFYFQRALRELATRAGIDV